MMTKTNGHIQQLVSQVASRMEQMDNDTALLESCPISIISMETWEWAQGVGLYGLWRYYEYSQEEDQLQFLLDWFNRNIEAGLPEKNINTVCPLLTLTYVYEVTKQERYKDIIKEWAIWVMEVLPRTQQGGFQHIVSGESNDGQLWDDTLFMTVLFLARAGKLLAEESYIEESIRQFLVHTKFLADRKTGLWYHGWTFNGNHHFAEALWARGNCWITIAIPEFIALLDGKHSGVSEFLSDTLRAQVKTLKSYQRSDGLWCTLIDDFSSYAETSASAGFAYGILKGIRAGLLDSSYKESALQAVNAVIKMIDEKGTVRGVSYGTGMGKHLDDYRNIPICPMTYGQALVLLMLTELRHHDI